MNLKGFLVTALTQALELGVAKPDDLLRHITPDVLAAHLPRPLWARLLTAALGAPRVDAELVIETIGLANLCEHVPSSVIWACITDLAERALGTAREPIMTRPSQAAPEPARSRSKPLTAPPPDVIAREPSQPVRTLAGPSIPRPTIQSPSDVAAELRADGRDGRDGREERAPISPPSRTRMPASQRFRQGGTATATGTGTGVSRLGQSSVRRPQAQAAAPVVASSSPRGASSEDVDDETGVGSDEDWRSALVVEDEQLVDWQASEETASGDDQPDRKR